MPPGAPLPPSPAPSSTKSAADLKFSTAAEKARSAFGKTIAGPALLPLSDSTSADAGREGLTRLGGAFLIAIDTIRPDPTQPREQVDDPALQELADSIRRHGILQPIAVRYVQEDGIHQIISGERRYQAARLVGLDRIPCWIKSPKEDDILVQQLVENWQRLELRPLELARALARLRDVLGLTQRQLARETGKSEGEVSKLLSLLTELSPDVQRQVVQSDADLSKRHLLAVARLPAQEQSEALADVRSKSLTAAQTETLVSTRLPRRTARTTAPRRITKFHYTCGPATVTITFRRSQVAAADILTALDAAKEQVALVKPELQIIRVKS